MIDLSQYEDGQSFEWTCDCGAIFEMEVYSVEGWGLPDNDVLKCESCGRIMAVWQDSPIYLYKRMIYAGPE